ncbi:hypothetical protein [Paenibacillus sp. BAC0078]
MEIWYQFEKLGITAAELTKLPTFAALCIENEILMHLRSLKKTKKDVFLHDPIGKR